MKPVKQPLMPEPKLRRTRRRGTVLVVALWTLSLLSVFAVYLGLSIQSKMTLHSRLENRSQLQYLTEAGVKMAVVFLNNDVLINKNTFTAEAKTARTNNPERFSSIELPEGRVEIGYPGAEGGQKFYGMTDEESKIDINDVEVDVLKKLFALVLGVKEAQADDLARAVVDWRERNPEISAGLFTDEHYASLKFPYFPKHAPFDVLEELSLVKGFIPRYVDQLRPFITIYSKGMVNFNTASATTLLALCFRPEFVEEFIKIRRGQDEVEATADDVVFADPETLDVDLQRFIPTIEGHDLFIIGELKKKRKLAADSSVYRIEAQGQLNNQQEKKRITCVFNILHSKIVYYREN